MKLSNLHTHTTYSDGRGSIRENVEEAVCRSFISLGISDHSHTAYENTCMRADARNNYISEVRKAAEEYAGKIEVYCGLELDSNSDTDTSEFDYVIASVHSLKIGEDYIPVDLGEAAQHSLIDTHFNGSEPKFAKRYYDELCRHIARSKPDIVGHFDLITKYDSIDEASPEYREIALSALREAVRHCNRFEVNTGGMARRHKKTPYPAEFLLRELLSLGGHVIVTSDAHDPAYLSYAFDETYAMLRRIGFRYADRLTADGFISEKI